MLVTRSGAVRVGRVDGAAVIKNSNGDTWVGEVTGALRVNAANGSIAVDRAQDTVAAKTANGDVRVGEVAPGRWWRRRRAGRSRSASARAWPPGSISTRDFGTVVSALDAVERPGAGEDVVEVRARSAFGDITVQRSGGRAAARS